MKDLICKEVDFNVEEIEKEVLEEKRAKRYAAEVKIYFIMKEFIKVLNQNAITPEFALKVIASGYRQTKDEYQIIFYVADEWQRYFVDGLAKCIKENWAKELNINVPCEYNLVEVLKDKLYVATYRVKSDHIVESNLFLFYHN